METFSLDSPAYVCAEEDACLPFPLESLRSCNLIPEASVSISNFKKASQKAKRHLYLVFLRSLCLQ